MPQKRTGTVLPLDLDELRKEVEEWYGLKRQAKTLDSELTKRKNRMKAILEKYGEKDEKGSLFLNLGEPIGPERITELKNQIAISDPMNRDMVYELLTEKDMWEEMTDLVRIPDEGRIRAAYFDKRLTLEELTQMFPQHINYSFWLLDDNGKQIR